MSEGRKFTKTDSNLSPEDRLAIVEKNYAVILERIQAYDKILEEFGLLRADLRTHGQLLDKQSESLRNLDTSTEKQISSIKSKVFSLEKEHESIKSIHEKQSEFVQKLEVSHLESCGKFYSDIEVLKVDFRQLNTECVETRSFVVNMQKDLTEVKKSVDLSKDKILNNSAGFLALEQQLKELKDTLRVQIDSLMNSFQNMPQFNEWATKIYIKVCNEISDRQKEFYHELDKRSQQLTKQLASDPYTAESVKRMLKEEMDELSMDGKNAYIKATNASQQIQLLEKKVENINLILKKYELNK